MSHPFHSEARSPSFHPHYDSLDADDLQLSPGAAAVRGQQRSSSNKFPPPPVATTVTDPAQQAAKDQEACETLWKVVYSTTIIWDRKLRNLNTALCVIALLNFLVILLLYQGCWNPESLEFSLGNRCISYRPAELACYVLVGIFLMVLIWYYYVKAGYKAFLSHFPSRWSAFVHSGLKKAFVWELLSLMIQPFPLLYRFINLSDTQFLVILALFARIYLVLRLLRDWSGVYQKRMFIKQNTRFDKSFFAMDYITIGKTYAYHYTGLVIVIGCVFSACVMAYLLHLCEREWWVPQHSNSGLTPIRYKDIKSPNEIQLIQVGSDGDTNGPSGELTMHYRGAMYVQSQFTSLLNSFYFVGVAATTTGFGDIAPITDQGKMFAVACAIMGITWSSFVVAVFTNKLVPTEFQAYVIDFLQRSEIEREKQLYAAMIIQKRWRLYKKNQRLLARGVIVPEHLRHAKEIEELTPVIRKFQSIQRKEMNNTQLWNQSTISQLDIMQQRQRNEGAPSGTETSHGEDPKFLAGAARQSPRGASASARAVQAASLHDSPFLGSLNNDSAGVGNVFSSTASSPLISSASPHMRQLPLRGASVQDPLLRSGGQKGYGSAASTADSHQVTILQRSTSDFGRRPSGPKKQEISAKNALKALHNLNRKSPASTSVTASPQIGPIGLHNLHQRRSSMGSITGLDVLGAGGGGGSMQSEATSNTIQSLLVAQLQMHSYLRALEQKLDVLLSRQPPQAGGEGMLSPGHTFLLWPASGVGEAKPCFVWHEGADSLSKHGTLYWTTDETAVQNRQKVKVEGQSFPLHLCSDVFLGKTTTAFTQNPSATELQSSCCFTLAVPDTPGLNLSAQSREERDRWISEFRQSFMDPRSSSFDGAAGSSSSLHGTPRRHRSPTSSLSTFPAMPLPATPKPLPVTPKSPPIQSRER